MRRCSRPGSGSLRPGRLLNVHRYGYRKGGAEAVFLDHAELFADRGWDCADFCMAHPKNLPSPFADDFPPHFEPRSGIRGLLDVPRFIYAREAKQRMAQLADRFQPDIAHVHGLYHQLTPAVLEPLAVRGIPIVYTLHDFKLLCPAYNFFTPRLGVCERCAGGHFWQCAANSCLHDSRAVSAVYALDAYVHRWRNSFDSVNAFVMPSRSILEKHREHGLPAEKLHYIPNFFETTTDATVEPELIAAARAEYGRYIAYFGRLSAEKGCAQLIEACATAGLPLVLIGEGPEEQRLRGLADRSETPVYFTGYHSGDALWALVEGALAVALPSIWYEIAPKSVLEAMARGKPVVASAIGGLPEQIEDGVTGLLAEPGSIPALAAALSRLAELDDVALETMSRRARERASSSFSTDRYYGTMMELYGRLQKARLGQPSRPN